MEAVGGRAAHVKTVLAAGIVGIGHALLEAKSCDTREGNVTFSRAMQTLERLKDYLGPTALEEYQTLGGE